MYRFETNDVVCGFEQMVCKELVIVIPHSIYRDIESTLLKLSILKLKCNTILAQTSKSRITWVMSLNNAMIYVSKKVM